MRTRQHYDAPTVARCNRYIQIETPMANERHDELDTSTRRKKLFLMLKRERDTTQNCGVED
jgi:hypothetical protein